MTFRAGQPNFSRGELAPELYGRFDVDAYAAGVKEAKNVIVMKYGGLTKRPGTRLVDEVIDGAEPARLIPFQFSVTQTYVLELGQGYMSPCATGGRLLEQELVITAITNAASAQVTIPYHGYVVGQRIYLTGVEDGSLADYLNGRFWKVLSVVDENNITIDADTSGLTAFVSSEGGITRTEEPDPPPPPPDVQPPVTPPDPPPAGGGGGGGFGGGYGGGGGWNNPIP